MMAHVGTEAENLTYLVDFFGPINLCYVLRSYEYIFQDLPVAAALPPAGVEGERYYIE